jgi:biopolymer transport protein ExbD
MRLRTHTDEGGVNLGIIITPMLDMSFQILAFFIMTYHPSALEGHFDIKLLPPKNLATKNDKAPKDELPPTGDEPELNDVLLVTVKTVARFQTEHGRTDGDPSRILLTRPEDAGNPMTIADSDIPFEDGLKKLQVELKKFLEDPTHSKANIKIEPDAELKHKYTMEVYDACKGSGFQNIQFVGPAYEAKK